MLKCDFKKKYQKKNTKGSRFKNYFKKKKSILK